MNIDLSKLNNSINNSNEVVVDKIVEVDINKITPNPKNFYNADFEIDKLSNSILSNGQIQPILINNNYMIVDGERRYRAHLNANLNTIKCVIKDIELLDEQIMLIEANRQRVKTPIERQEEVRILSEYYTLKKSSDPNFKGRVVEHVAQTLDVSVSTVQRDLKVEDNQTVTQDSNIILDDSTKNLKEVKKLINQIHKVVVLEILDEKIANTLKKIVVELDY